MKYAKQTLKYIKSNLLLIPCFIVAIFALSLLIDIHSYNAIASSIQGGSISNSFTAWLKFFLLLNTDNWVMILSGIAAYLVLVLDLALIHSLIDNHVRFGSKSFRSIANSFNINVVNGFIFAIFALVAMFISTVIMAAIMKTSCLLQVDYSYIIGIIVCAAVLIFMLFISSLFMLWLPCVEITGFKKFEALNYSYSLARTRIRSIFLSVAPPAFVTVVVSIAIALAEITLLTYIALPIIMALLYMYSAVLSYIVYVDAEGIEREDLKKY